jgi:hypothetical protein
MKRRTIVVEGPLAFRMRRIAAARRGEIGVQILTLPMLAARLAGGFIRAAESQDIEPAIRQALGMDGFAELEAIRGLPGMTRSVALTLRKIWQVDLPLDEWTAISARVRDIALLERRVRSMLPAGVLTPRDLRDAAMDRVHHAEAVLGAVDLDRVQDVPPVWRTLLSSLSGKVELRWGNPGSTDLDWFPGSLAADRTPEVPAPRFVSCADPQAEAVESLRWIRELIASGRARPEEIAICAAATDAWDEQMLVLAADADLPVHFSHGIPALGTRDGQACAALADVLLSGLSQDRIRRLFGHARGRSRALSELQPKWAQGLMPAAALFRLDQWKQALDRAQESRTDGSDPRAIIVPVLEFLEGGSAVARQAGEMLLGSSALSLWTEALRRAPAEALDFSLRDLRVPDDRDPGACVVWCPAGHLAGAVRPWVRMLGLTTRSWPRRAADDPLLPDHIVPRARLEPTTVTENDRKLFQVISSNASGGCVLSRSRRNAQGGMLAASPLVPAGEVAVLKRTRIPHHAFSESDRLRARPVEAAETPHLAAATACWRDWRRPEVTAHDGWVRPDHPVIRRAIDQVQSATSLRLLLRDPLAFVWRYALGWHPVPYDVQPLVLDARAYGQLVHEILKRGVDTLEASHHGYARASAQEIEAALADATASAGESWPLDRSVPPLMLWQHILDAAERLAMKALTLDETLPDTRSWTELAFGGDGEEGRTTDNLPWPPHASVVIPGTNIRVRGSIDRLDINAVGSAVRVSDYKTGAVPRQADRSVLGGGAELQRVIYALAARQLVPDDPRVVARLVYLVDESPRIFKLQDVDLAIEAVAADVTAACAVLLRGVALPGPDAREPWNDFRLALPAADGIFQVKQAAVSRAFGDFSRVWSRR